jgi:2-polyprenyl-6-methoxyphenol hydroxylase-like FAD-dependent oxidoreductase
MSATDRDQMPERPETDVLIAGAGPTGLLLAAELQRRDVRVLLIDAHDAPMGWDRATVVHPRSLEIFESLGIVEPVLEAGVRIRAARFHSDGEVLGALEFSNNDSRYGFDIGLSEETTERVLTEYLEDVGGGVTRSSRLVGLEQGSDRVVATLECEGKRREVDAAYLVGCDGFRSTVRVATGIEYGGSTEEEPWAVFDAGVENWNAGFDITCAHFDETLVILTPLPGERFRVYLRPPAGTTDFETTAREILDRYSPGVAFTDVANPTPFRCHARLAEHFRAGRVLLAGDAAHACSPTEGHGMNTGLQDAYNLGWKLALVCRGEGGQVLLDSYEFERRPVAARIVQSGADSDAAQALVEPGQRAARDAEVVATFSNPESVHHEAAAAAEIDRSYAGSPVVFGDGSGIAGAGRLLPDTAPALMPGGEALPLHDFAHRTGHTLFVIGGPGAPGEQVGALLAEIEAAASEWTPVDAAFGFTVDEAGGRLGRIEAATAAQLEVAGVTLLAVRPDRYIGLRQDEPDVAALTGYLDTLAA